MWILLSPLIIGVVVYWITSKVAGSFTGTRAYVTELSDTKFEKFDEGMDTANEKLGIAENWVVRGRVKCTEFSIAVGKFLPNITKNVALWKTCATKIRDVAGGISLLRVGYVHSFVLCTGALWQSTLGINFIIDHSLVVTIGILYAVQFYEQEKWEKLALVAIATVLAITLMRQINSSIEATQSMMRNNFTVFYLFTLNLAILYVVILSVPTPSADDTNPAPDSPAKA